ncbi:MAG: glycoside hydrolase N-terminal domain-containing protein [Oscillospiraceae bacterium]
MKSYKLPKENCDILAKKAIASWDEALPLGNGKMGCLIWGASDALRLSLDRGDLWDNTPAPELSDERYRFKNLVQAAKDGDMHTQLELFDAPYRHAAPTKLPAGKLVLQFAPGLPVSSRLHLADAQACVKIGESPIVLESFLSVVAPVGLIRLSCPAGSFRFAWRIPNSASKPVKIRKTKRERNRCPPDHQASALCTAGVWTAENPSLV